MSVGKQVLNQAKDQLKNKLTDIVKKAAGALMKNPYFWLVVAVVFIIIVIVGTFMEVEAEEYSTDYSRLCKSK